MENEVISKSRKTILKKVKTEKVYGASLLKICQSFFFVHDHEKVLDLAAEFQHDHDLQAVGVVDREENVLGIITRTHLFNLLGKPYGREVLSKKPVSDVVETVDQFDMHANLFQTAEHLNQKARQSTETYYLLTHHGDKFRGIFSSKELLYYLSQITQEDISLAGKLQERLVKSRESFDELAWSCDAFSHSAKGLGGDLYHIAKLDNGKVFFALGDVSGKGAAASILTSLLWGVLQFYDYRKGLKTLLKQINEALIRTFHLEKYLTGVFMLYNPETHEMNLADMGHGHSWLIRDGRPRALRFPNMNLPLGIDIDLNPQVYRLRLRKNDLIVAYTDGLVEQENEQGKELGEDAVLSTVVTCFPRVQDIPDTLQDKLMRHQGPVPRLDDVTWMQVFVK